MIADLLSTDGFVPRWSCGAFPTTLGWVHVVSDVATFVAYAAIPLLILFFLRRRGDLPFPRVFWLFAAFIFFCGTVHLVEAIIFWSPVYQLSGTLKAITAAVSLATVGALVPILPRALALPSTAQAMARLAAIVSASSDAILSKTADGTILSWNAGAERMYGYAADEVVGRHVSLLTPPERRGELSEIMRRIRHGERVGQLETERVTKSGMRIPVSMTVSPILDGRGKVIGASTIARDISARKHSERRLRDTAERLARANRELRELAGHDPLTGLLNRRGLEAALERETERMLRQGTRGAAVILDCDDFKDVNERFGHDGGDVALREIAERLREVARGSDRIARIGGDEFLVLLPDTRVAEAAVIADRMRLAVQDTPIGVPGGEVTVTVSAGVDRLDPRGAHLEQILASTSTALRRSKDAGKNAVARGDDVLAHPGFSSTGIRTVAQAIHEVASGRIVGHELLVRGPAGSFEQPNDFFRACRERRILTATDLECLRLCVAAARAVPRELRVHVNLFPSTLLHAHGSAVAACVAALPHPERMCLELNEAMLVGDPVSLVQETRALRAESRALLAIDDVGYGRSSLEALIVLEPDVVKIDRQYVSGASADRGQRQHLARLVNVARALDAEIIAEGVEREQDRAVLHDLGVERAQGYFWGRPAPLS